MNTSHVPVNQVYWYQKPSETVHLERDETVDLVVVGGGFAGLHAAQAAARRGLKVALLEKDFCGSGASGKSSGFITPDAEFSFGDLVDMHGPERALALWDFISSGVEIIRANIHEYAIDCQFQKKDSLMLASSASKFNTQIVKEYEARTRYRLEATLYDTQRVKQIVGSTRYYGGISYNATFSIKAFDYCQGLKKVLCDQGVAIYEESPVTALCTDGVSTARAYVRAKNVVVATDYALPDLAPFAAYDVYHVQTFLMVSAQLPEEQARALFPAQDMMAWDTDFIYHYFRLTQDNRLLLGGGTIFSTYARSAHYHNRLMFYMLDRYAKRYFPDCSFEWDSMWPGLIGITKDIFSFAGKDNGNPHRYYVSGATGLPWATALGNYAIDSLLDGRKEFDDIFSPYRRFFIPHALQTLIGTRAAFALSNFKQVGSL